MEKETLEEAALRYASKKLQRTVVPYKELNANVAEYVGFINGAKWQAERMYSEEDIALAFNEGQAYSVTGKLVDGKEWVKTHKKNGLNNLKRNSMKKEFVPYNIALRLKALGFDEPCFATYLKSEFLGYPEVTLCLYSKENIELGNTKNSYRLISLPECCSAPTFSQAFRWFRDKYGDYLMYSFGVVPHFNIMLDLFIKDSTITYEEAELACLDKLLEIVESKSK